MKEERTGVKGGSLLIQNMSAGAINIFEVEDE